MKIEKLIVLVQTDKDTKLRQVVLEKQGMEMLIATLGLYTGKTIQILGEPIEGIELESKRPTKTINTEGMTC